MDTSAPLFDRNLAVHAPMRPEPMTRAFLSLSPRSQLFSCCTLTASAMSVFMTVDANSSRSPTARALSAASLTTASSLVGSRMSTPSFSLVSPISRAISSRFATSSSMARSTLDMSSLRESSSERLRRTPPGASGPARLPRSSSRPRARPSGLCTGRACP